MLGLFGWKGGRAIGCAALAVALGGCGGIFSDSPFGGDDDDGTDTDPSTVPEGDEGPSTVPPGTGCESSSDCGDCQYCSEGSCVEDVGGCCAVGGDPGWRCSPPIDDCDWEGCADGYECTFDGCVPVGLPDTFNPTVECETPLAMQALPLTMPLSTLAPALIDADGDGTMEIVTVDTDNVIRAVASDGTVVSTLEPGGQFFVTEWLPGDGGSLLATGVTGPSEATIGRLEVVAPGELRLTIGESAPSGASASTARDFTGDGTTDVGRMVDGSLQLWELNPDPALTLEAAVAADVQRLEAFDFGADGSVEWLGFGQQTVQLSPQADMIGAMDWYALPGDYVDSGAVTLADGSEQLVIVTTSEQSGHRSQVTRIDTSAGPPALLDPFGAQMQYAWSTVADLDGDGADEVVVAHSGEGRVYHLAGPDPKSVPCHSALLGLGDMHGTSGDVTGDGVADLVASDGMTYTLWTTDAS